MMCTVKPMPINVPMVIMTVAIATIIGAEINAKLRKNHHIKRKIAKPASGAEIAI